MLDEGRLQGMQFASIRESFDRRNLRSVSRHCQNEARIDALSIDQNRAGTTLPLVAAFLGAGKLELLAQEIEKGDPRRKMQLMAGAIDRQYDRNRLRRG